MPRHHTKKNRPRQALPSRDALLLSRITDSLGCPSLLPSTASSGLSLTPGVFRSKANEKPLLERISLDSTSMTRSHPSLQTEVLEEADRDPELMMEERSLKKRTLTERISIKNLEPLHQ